jgi:hypothetical protein
MLRRFAEWLKEKPQRLVVWYSMFFLLFFPFIMNYDPLGEGGLAILMGSLIGLFHFKFMR